MLKPEIQLALEQEFERLTTLIQTMWCGTEGFNAKAANVTREEAEQIARSG